MPMSRVSYAGHGELPRDQLAWTDESRQYSKAAWDASGEASVGTRRLSFEPRGGYHLPYRIAEPAPAHQAFSQTVSKFPRKHVRERDSKESLEEGRESAAHGWPNDLTCEDVRKLGEAVKRARTMVRQAALEKVSHAKPIGPGYASLSGGSFCESTTLVDMSFCESSSYPVCEDNPGSAVRLRARVPPTSPNPQQPDQKPRRSEARPKSARLGDGQKRQEKDEGISSMRIKPRSNAASLRPNDPVGKGTAQDAREESRRTELAAIKAGESPPTDMGAWAAPEPAIVRSWQTPSPSNSSAAGSSDHMPKPLRRVKGMEGLRPSKSIPAVGSSTGGDAEIRSDKSALQQHVNHGRKDAKLCRLGLDANTKFSMGKTERAFTLPMHNAVAVSKTSTFPGICPKRHDQKRIPSRITTNGELVESSEESDGDFSVESDFYSLPNSSSDLEMLPEDDPLQPLITVAATKLLKEYRGSSIRERGGSREPIARGDLGPSPASSSWSHARKRSRSTRDGSESCSPLEERAVPAVSKRAKVSNKPSRMLACPFWKKDPENHRHCYKKVLSKIKYVKGHLYKFHEEPIFCPCCGLTFQDEVARDQHLRARRCEVVDQPCAQPKGLTRAQRLEVQKRADPKLSEEEQWFAIWAILFPGHRRPQSAYIDGELSEDMCSFREYFTSVDATAIMGKMLATAGHVLDQGQRREMFDRAVVGAAFEQIYQGWWTLRRGRRAEIPSMSTQSAATEEFATISRESLGREAVDEPARGPPLGTEHLNAFGGQEDYFELEPPIIFGEEYFNVEDPGFQSSPVLPGG